ARIDASGTAGGGEIAFGQTRQGSAAPRRAERTGVAAGAELRADATVLGQGGRVVLHSTDTTLMAGTISARGGPQGGGGGFVEVSGERGFRMLGAIDVSAPAGRSGTVLFDPDNLRISDGPAGGDTPVTGADLSDFVLGFGEAMTNAVITTTQIGGIAGDLVLQATNSITVESAVFKGQGGLTLQTGSAGSIAINASIGLGIGDLVLIAGTGGITQASGAAISLNSGQLRVQSGGDVSLTATGNTVPRLGPSDVTGNFTIAASGLGSAAEVLLEGAITVSGTFDITALNATLRQAVNSVITTSRLNAAATGGFGLGGSVLLDGANQIATLGAVTASDFISIVNATSLVVEGPVLRTGSQTSSVGIRVTNGDLTVNGTINAAINGTGSFSLRAAGNVIIGANAVVTGAVGEGSSTIGAATPDGAGNADRSLPGGVTLAGTVNDNQLNLQAGQGGIVQTGGSITVTRPLALYSGGDVILDRGGQQEGAPNAISGGFSLSFPAGAPRAFVLDNGSTDIRITQDIVATSIGLRTTGALIFPGTSTFFFPSSLNAGTGRVSLRIGDLQFQRTGTLITGGVVEITPATSSPVVLPVQANIDAPLPANAFVLSDTELAQIAASNILRIGAATFRGVTDATAASVSIVGPLAFAGTLDLRSLGDITQASGANLTVGALTGQAGGAVTLTNPGNNIGFLDDFSAGGGFALTAGAINLRGLVSTPGQLATLTSAGGIQSVGTGRIEAGELRAATQAGSISLTGANQLDRLGESSAPGDFTLVNAGPQMTIPSGQTVQAGGTGNVTATAGSITVDGTIRAASLSLSAPAGTVTVNGFSAIAFAGGLTLSAQNVAVAGLIAGSTSIDVNATQAASLAGIAQTPTLTVSAPSIGFGGLDASASDVVLNLGGGGNSTGSLSAAALRVVDGAGVTLTGSIAGNGTSAAAALGRRFAGGTQLGDPPPDRFDYLFNGCPIAASSCAPPVPSVDIPVFTVADNPRGLMGELDPAGQPLANPLVRIPVLPFITQSGRDTSEDRELAPPNIRAEDF
ncbi:beta strand repeat-containing protein, partial [Plastoroseomonas hellenica]|uniref:beta strand repeat-containing protein n=1 Tax=Plastoroseomonas hellenica TaxID=2687306 RepID=UPI001BA706B8